MLALAGWSHPALAATEFLRFETAVARASRQAASLETGSEGRPESMPSTSQLHTWYRAQLRTMPNPTMQVYFLLFSAVSCRSADGPASVPLEERPG